MSDQNLGNALGYISVALRRLRAECSEDGEFENPELAYIADCLVFAKEQLEASLSPILPNNLTNLG